MGSDEKANSIALPLIIKALGLLTHFHISLSLAGDGRGRVGGHEKVENLDGIPAMLQEFTRAIEALLRANIPVSAQQVAIYPHITLRPIFHIQEGIYGILQLHLSVLVGPLLSVPCS